MFRDANARVHTAGDAIESTAGNAMSQGNSSASTPHVRHPDQQRTRHLRREVWGCPCCGGPMRCPACRSRHITLIEPGNGYWARCEACGAPLGGGA